MLKAGGDVTVQWLMAIFNAVWRTGVTPKNGGELSLSQSTRKAAAEFARTTEGSVC